MTRQIHTKRACRLLARRGAVRCPKGQGKAPAGKQLQPANPDAALEPLGRGTLPSENESILHELAAEAHLRGQAITVKQKQTWSEEEEDYDEEEEEEEEEEEDYNGEDEEEDGWGDDADRAPH